MKSNWLITSIIAGAVAGGIAFYFGAHPKVSAVVAIITSVIVFTSNPKKRYMKAFWIVLSAFLTLNKLFFYIAGNLFGIEFKVGSNNLPPIVSIALLLLAGLLLLLDKLERGGKLEGTLFEININKNTHQIKGNNNQINQSITNKSFQAKDDKPKN
jgi:hypothetical protein